MLLGIDTATRNVGLALHTGTELLAEHMWVTRGYHTVELAPEIALMLRKANRSVSELSAIAVASGPGSYTGLRIGMALGKGLSLAHNLKMISIPTLDILAVAQPAMERPMFAFIQAGRGRIAGAWYESIGSGWDQVGETGTMSMDELVKTLDQEIYLCGEFTSQDRSLLAENEWVTMASPADCVRRPGILADLAWERIRAGEIEDPKAIVPHYLPSRSVAG
jgi:tRNA threonylcarbamoyladenosine biosynthesis protein TsaB